MVQAGQDGSVRLFITAGFAQRALARLGGGFGWGPGLNSVYLGLWPVPPELGPRVYQKGKHAGSCWEVGVMGEGLNALPGGALAALDMLAERFL